MSRSIPKKLTQYVVQDSELFDAVLEARRQRDAATENKDRQKYKKMALQKLRRCTNLLRDIAKECIEVAKIGTLQYKICYRAARGEPATAVYAAIAGASSALMVAHLNLSSFRNSKWALELRQECLKLSHVVNEIQRELVKSIRDIGDDIEAALGAARQMNLLPQQKPELLALEYPKTKNARRGKRSV